MTNFLSSGITPSLIHAVDITIRRIDLSTIDYDDDLREPKGDLQFLAPEELLAQIHWMSITDKRKMGPGGDNPDIEGWITLRHIDLEDLPSGLGKLKKSDRIVSVDDQGEKIDFSAENLVIDDIDHKGHYAKSHLVRYFFVRRQTAF